MNKREILELLDKEVDLFKITEDENSLGELYITELQFKEINEILNDLKKIRLREKDREKDLRNAIEGNERFTVLKDIKESILDKTIFTDFPIKGPYLLIDSNFFISNCIVNQKNDIGEPI